MQPVLEVGIGLILAVAALSVVVSSTMELISALMRLRAKSLEQGIARMLDDQRRKPKRRGGKVGAREPDRPSPAAAAVLNHPLIKALSSGRSTDRAPSYIDAVTFATALLGSSLEAPVLVSSVLGTPDELTTAIAQLPEEKSDIEAVWKAANGDVGKFVAALLALPTQDRARAALASLVGDRDVLARRISVAETAGSPAAAALRPAFDEATAGGTFDARAFIDNLVTPQSISDAQQAFGDVKATLANIKATNPHLGDSLEALYDRAESDFTRFRQEIEDWFDREMARVSGWYSRWTQWVMVGVGITLALLLNVSAVTIGKVLWQDETLRESIAELAPSTNTTSTATSTTLAPTTSTLAPRATTSSTGATGAGAEGPGLGTSTTSVPPVDDTEPPPSLEKLQEHGLPIGWNDTAWPGRDWYLALHLLGILMAGIAVSFGAPFWFDLLNRFVNLRAAGKPPEPAAKNR